MLFLSVFVGFTCFTYHNRRVLYNAPDSYKETQTRGGIIQMSLQILNHVKTTKTTKRRRGYTYFAMTASLQE